VNLAILGFSIRSGSEDGSVIAPTLTFKSTTTEPLVAAAVEDEINLEETKPMASSNLQREASAEEEFN